MSNFVIDFYELCFLAEACIPPRPIARAMFWQNLTNLYWEKMTENERAKLFDWMNRNDWYKESLQNEEDTKIFHARFDPDNQYMVQTNYNDEIKETHAFKRLSDEKEGWTNRYYVKSTTYIEPDFIIGVKKIEHGRKL
jgi:hypothetical protein